MMPRALFGGSITSPFSKAAAAPIPLPAKCGYHGLFLVPINHRELKMKNVRHTDTHGDHTKSAVFSPALHLMKKSSNTTSTCAKIQ